MAQRIKHLPAMRETWVWSLGWEDPLEKEMTTYKQYSWLENPMDRGAWWATVRGVAKSWTRLSNFTHTHTHTHTHTGNLGKWYKWLYRIEWLTYLKNELMVTRRETLGGRDRLKVWDWYVYTTVFKVDYKQKPIVWHRECSSIFCNILKCKRIWKIHIYI